MEIPSSYGERVWGSVLFAPPSQAEHLERVFDRIAVVVQFLGPGVR